MRLCLISVTFLGIAVLAFSGKALGEEVVVTIDINSSPREVEVNSRVEILQLLVKSEVYFYIEQIGVYAVKPFSFNHILNFTIDGTLTPIASFDLKKDGSGYVYLRPDEKIYFEPDIPKTIRIEVWLKGEVDDDEMEFGLGGIGHSTLNPPYKILLDMHTRGNPITIKR